MGAMFNLTPIGVTETWWLFYNRKWRLGFLFGEESSWAIVSDGKLTPIVGLDSKDFTRIYEEVLKL